MIADKIISVGKSKLKERKDETEEIHIPPEKRQQIISDLREGIHIPPEKRQQIINDLRLFQTSYKNGMPKKL